MQGLGQEFQSTGSLVLKKFKFILNSKGFPNLGSRNPQIHQQSFWKSTGSQEPEELVLTQPLLCTTAPFKAIKSNTEGAVVISKSGGSNFKGTAKNLENGLGPRSWNFGCPAQEIPPQFHRLHIWNLEVLRIKMMYNMSYFFQFEFFGPYNLG